MNAHLTPPRGAAHVDAGLGQAISLSALIGRIDEAVERETHGLKTDRNFDIADSNMRKSRFLYELNRAVKVLAPSDLTAEHREALIKLRATLARNEATIRAHMEAVGEVANLVRDALRNAETDGTYSSGGFGYGE
jgi:hypothetical protein